MSRSAMELCKMGLLLFAIALIISISSAAPRVGEIKKSKIDDRFSSSRDFIQLNWKCTSISSIGYRETRLMTMCNPPVIPLGIPMEMKREVYRYDLEIMGKPDSLFTIKEEPDSAHNSYDENEVLKFALAPDQCKSYSITNLGDGVKNSRIILKLQDIRRPMCNERKQWIDKHKKNGISLLAFLPNPDAALAKAMRVILVATLKMQPIKGLDVILKTFWPKTEPSIWDKVKHEIGHRVKEAVMARINETSRQHLRVYRDKLHDLETAITLGNAHIESLFMSISSIFIGNENFVMFDGESVSREMLPFFTSVISLFINFHIFAVASAAKYNFHSDNVELLKNRRDRLVESAHNYIMKVYDDNMEHAFDTCDVSSNFYNCIVDVHNDITQSGIQFLPTWRSVSEYRSNDSRVHDPMFYSHSYGIPSTELLKSTLFHTTKAFPLITPAFSKKGCNLYSSDEKCFERLNANHIYVTYHDESKRISKMWFSVEKSNMSEYSAIMWDSITLYENETISRIIVGGEGIDGKIEYIKFVLSNGEHYTFGYINYNLPSTSRKAVTFEQEDHFVAQAVILNDDSQHEGNQKNLANSIVVSYRRNRHETQDLS